MANQKNVTVEDINRYVSAYEPLMAESKERMRQTQSIIDGDYKVIPKKIPGLTEYHPTHLFGRLLKTIDRVAATKPQIKVLPDGKGKAARSLADKTEEQLDAWIYGMSRNPIMHPWRGLVYFAMLRGKTGGCGPEVNDYFRMMVPKRANSESESDYAARVQQSSGRRREGAPFSYTPIDPLELIHPPTMRRTPPWVIRSGQMEFSQIKALYPFWSNPQSKGAERNGSYVDMIAFCSEYQMGLLADGEVVSNRGPDKHGKVQGELLENPYGRVFYDVVYSGRGYMTSNGASNSFGGLSAEARIARDREILRGITTPEARLTVGLLDNDLEDILLQAVVVTAARVYAGRYVDPAFTGGMTPQEFSEAMNKDVRYFEAKQGEPPVKPVEQPPFPSQVLDTLYDIAGGSIELNTMPNIGMGVNVPGITSGYQTRTTQAPIDLQSVALRETIEHVIEDTARECIYAAKHVMTTEQAEEACRYISRDKLPDAPDVRVTLEPPDEEARARKASLAEKIRDKLDDDTLREEFGFENNEEIRRRKMLDDFVKTPQAVQAVLQLGSEKFGIMFDRMMAERAAARAINLPPQQNGSAPTPEQGLTPQAPGVPPAPPIAGSPEQMALATAQGMRQTVPVPQGG